MPEVPRHLTQFYMFTSDKILKVIDVEGVVHDTELYHHMTYRRRTCCDGVMWHTVEPINRTDDDAVVTCISCLGASHG